MSILVSISYITYNHEKYAAQALESFLMQKTDFNYEILVHDDASTDGTAVVIKEYADKYPDIIKPIYQSENQFSQGRKVSTTFNVPRAQGKYIAFCDGDDYWTDPRKLQKQADYMESNPECSMCFHTVMAVTADSIPNGGFLRPYKENRLVPVEDIILGVGFSGISSIFYRRECMTNPPDFYLQAPVGDVFLVLSLVIQGTLYYFAEAMSALRTSVPGSWTRSMQGSKDRKLQFRKDMIRSMQEFNRFTDYKYGDTVESRLAEFELLLFIAQGNTKGLKDAKYKKHYKRLGLYAPALIYLNKYFPSLYNRLRYQYRKFIIAKLGSHN